MFEMVSSHHMAVRERPNSHPLNSARSPHSQRLIVGAFLQSHDYAAKMEHSHASTVNKTHGT